MRRLRVRHRFAIVAVLILSLGYTTPADDKPAVDTKKTVLPHLYSDALPDGAVVRLGTARFRHGYAATSLAFSPDGKMVASSESGNWVHVWDAATGRELTRFGGGKTSPSGMEGIHAIALSPDGKRIITGGNATQAMVLWDITTGREIISLRGHQGPILAVAYSPDNRTVASGGGEKTIRLWDTTTGQELRQLLGHEGWVRCIAFSPGGTILASCAETIRLWDATTGKELRRCDGHRFEVNSVAFSPDGKVLASGSDDKTIRLWNVDSGKELRQFNSQQIFVLAIAFSPNGKGLASAGLDGSIQLWEVATGAPVRAFEGHDGPVASLAFSPDGKVLASAGGDKIARGSDWGGDKIVRLWDVATGKELRKGGGHHNTVSSAAFSADGRTIATGGQDGTVRLWDAATGEERYRYDNTAQPALPQKGEQNRTSGDARQPVQAVAFSPDGQLLAWAGRRIRLCDTATRRELRRLGKEGDPVLSITFSPDGKLLAAGNRSGWLRLYDVSTGQEQKLLGGGEGGITCLSFSPDGKAIVMAQERSTNVTVWEVDTGNRLLCIPVAQDLRAVVKSVAFSPEGSKLVTGLAAFNTQSLVDNLYLWDAKTGRVVGQLDGQFGQIAAVVFSPDGRTLASASGENAFYGGSDRTIRLWEIATGRERCRFQGHQSGISSIAFAPDGRSLVSAGEDSTAIVWDITGLRRSRRLPDLRVAGRDLESRWRDLAQADAAHAHAIVWSLVAAPQQTVAFFKDHLRPAPPADPNWVNDLITELANDRFPVRQHATQELGRLGELVEPTLRQKLKEKIPLEMRRRLERLLQKVEPAAFPERLQETRAIEVLEHIGTSEAQQLLQTLAKGTPEARRTQEAKASLERLAKRPVAGR
jgi:WD40 repeat protein